MKSLRCNSTKPLDEAGNIQHLVQTTFDTQISWTLERKQGSVVRNLPRKLWQFLETDPQTREITEVQFNEALRRSRKDTAPGPDNIWHSDILNLRKRDIMTLRKRTGLRCDTLGSTSTDADLQATCGNNSTEVQERSVSPEGYGCIGRWTKPCMSLPCQSVVLGVTDYGLGLTTMARTNQQKLDKVQGETIYLSLHCLIAAHLNTEVILLITV